MLFLPSLPRNSGWRCHFRVLSVDPERHPCPENIEILLATVHFGRGRLQWCEFYRHYNIYMYCFRRSNTSQSIRGLWSICGMRDFALVHATRHF